MIYKKIDNKCSKSVVENSKYLDKNVHNSKNALLLHNVKIEYKGERVTIDHILISRMGIEILKSKNFGNQEIAIGGDSALIIDTRHYSNPLEKIEKERSILESFLKDKLPLPSNKYWFIESKIKIDITVIFGVNSNIVNEKLPIGFDRVENYFFNREKKISKINRLTAFKLLANMLNAKTIKDIATLLSKEEIKTIYSHKKIENEELIAS